MRYRLPSTIGLAIACGGCGHGSEPPALGSAGSGSDAGAPVVTSSWPTGPVPALPPELAELRWPMTAKQVAAKWPALADNAGMQVAEVKLKLQPSIDPFDARIWIEKPGVYLRVLERAWGPRTRDRLGHSLWFDPKRGVRARYPAYDAARREGVELSHYRPVLDRIAAAPNGMVAGARPLLGQKANALDSYQPWIALRDDKVAQLALPAGEWDPTHLAVGAGIEKGRIVRVAVTVRVDAPPADEAAVRQLLDRRWGTPRKTADTTVWTRDGVTVELTRAMQRFPVLVILYSTK